MLSNGTCECHSRVKVACIGGVYIANLAASLGTHSNCVVDIWRCEE